MMDYELQPSPTRTANKLHSEVPGYARGQWTPSVGGTSVSTGEGSYIKLGDMVFVSCLLVITTIGTGSKTQISGLPFIVSNVFQSAGVGAVLYTNLVLNVVNVVALANTSQTTIELLSATIADNELSTNNILGDG